MRKRSESVGDAGYNPEFVVGVVFKSVYTRANPELNSMQGFCSEDENYT